MSNQDLLAASGIRSDHPSSTPRPGADHAGRISPTLSGHGGSTIRSSHAWLDGGIQPAGFTIEDQGSVPGGGQCAPGSRDADGCIVWPHGGRGPGGRPQFDQTVPPGGYLWWYLDAISDDGQYGLTIIAFVGSVFSPYYALRRARHSAGKVPDALPDDFCCLNVALYHKGSNRWAMTERGSQFCSRTADHFQIGPSAMRWVGDSLHIDIHEVTVPIPRKILGTIVVHPQTLFDFSTPLDPSGRHRWGPLAPGARVEVALSSPAQSWQGHAYLDSNEGDEPIDRPFKEWDWSRSVLKDGSVAVLYDLQYKKGPDHLLALRFHPDGKLSTFEAPPRVELKPTAWRISRRMRSSSAVALVSQLEDTPFYQRCILQSQLLGEDVLSFHETLSVPRLVSPIVQAMLPWRMPRRS